MKPSVLCLTFIVVYKTNNNYIVVQIIKKMLKIINEIDKFYENIITVVIIEKVTV